MTFIDMEDEGSQERARLYEDRSLQEKLERKINLLLATDMKRQKEVHVSDLLFLRKGYFGKTFYEPLTDTELGLFAAGKGHHMVIQSLRDSGEIEEMEVEWKGIKGSIDLLGDTVTEIKTTRVRKKYTVETVPPHWMEQLGSYVAMVHPTSTQAEGILFVLYLISAEFRTYRVTFEDLPRIRARMESKADQLRTALKAKNYLALPLCPEWLCSELKCKFYSRCGPPKVLTCQACNRLYRTGSMCKCQLKLTDEQSPWKKTLNLSLSAMPTSWAPRSPKQ